MLLTAIVSVVMGVILVSNLPWENYLEASAGMVLPLEQYLVQVKAMQQVCRRNIPLIMKVVAPHKNQHSFYHLILEHLVESDHNFS